MALLSDYTAGTISVSADETVVTGADTAWQVAGFKEGDWFIANGWVNVVASVESNTSLTLSQPWRGGELTDAPYRLRYMSDGSRASAQARQLIDMLGGSGSLEALAAITGSPNTIPYFTGAGTMGLLTRADLVQGVHFDVQVDELADRDDYDGEDEGFAVLVSDVGDGRSAVYSRVGESGNWTDPAYVTGPVGPANTLAKGTVTTGDPGSEANFSITGDAPNQTLNLTLPRGATGPANSLSKGTVTTGAPGSEADFSITGTAPSQTLSLTIPRGDKGEGLHADVQVDELSDRDDYDDEDTGFSVLVSNVGDGRAAIYSKNSNASADWSDPAYVTGASGASAAEDVTYDNAESGLDADDVQAAIDELAARPVAGVFIKADTGSVVLLRTGNGTASLKAGTSVELAGKMYTFESDEAIVMPTLAAGTDYAVYVCSDGTVRADASFTAPDGYTTDDSRQIGGFHYAPGGNATGTSGGNTTPQINEYSFWDVKWRPACKDPRGMTLVNDSFWVDIYLTGVDHHVNGTSKYNVTIANGSSPPKIPAAFGGNGTTTYATFRWYEANEVMQSHGKDLLSHGEFSMAMHGTTEESSGGTDPVSTILREAYTSKYGVMLSTGNLWVWSRDFSTRVDGDTTTWAWKTIPGGKGNAYTQGTYGLVAARLGGDWNNAANSGSRASHWVSYPWASGSLIGARGRCDHVRLE